MKKIVSVFLIALLMSLPVFATHDYDSCAVSNVVKTVPEDIATFDLHTKSTNQTKDTLLTTRCNLYGPFEMCKRGWPSYSSMVIRGDVVTGTGPTIAIDFQVINGVTLKDTAGPWTSACTLGVTNSAGAVRSYVSLANYAGKSIVIKAHNYDAQQGEIPGFLGVVFKTSYSALVK
jgi:hypothetical protein